jgi:hypothetical protein
MVIILQNITGDMMFYLQDRITQLNGVHEILSSPKAHDLVDKSLFKTVRHTLLTSLDSWVRNEIPSDAQPADDQFAGPARVKPLYDDGLSSGDSSWVTQSNASFMSMELPTGPDDDYFASSTNANKVFTYVHVVFPHKPSPPPAPDIDLNTKASISEISDTKTYADYVRKNDLETVTEAHHAETAKANQIIAAQRLEIEQLIAQRLEDIAQRLEDTKTAKNKASAQEEATAHLKVEAIQTKLEIHELRREMQDMIQQFKMALATTAPSQENKRHSTASAEDNFPSEKRRDVRSTPGKQLFTEVMDLRDSHEYLSVLEATDTPKSPKK